MVGGEDAIVLRVVVVVVVIMVVAVMVRHCGLWRQAGRGR